MDPVLVWRLLVAVFVIVTPTLLFLGLWRGLMRLRDDDLVQRVEARMDESPAARPKRNRTARMDRRHSTTASGGDGGSAHSTSSRGPAEETVLVTCDRCGAENLARFDYCRECLTRISGD